MRASSCKSLLSCVAVLLLSALVSVTTVHAQAADPARSASARTLFEEGLKKADAAAWTEAADLFQRALALRDSPVIRFNLSAAWVELGRLVEASELLRALQNDERTDTEVQKSASDKRQVLLPRLAQLTIVVEGHDPSQLVLLDEQKVSPDKLGVAFAVDPRVHHLVLRAGERVLDQKQVLLVEGEALEVKLTGAVEAPVVVAAPVLRRRSVAATSSEVDEPAPTNARQRRRRLWWGVGTGVAAVAAGVVAGVLLAQQKSEGSPDAFSPGTVSVRVPR
jgi:hypothetical protein